MTPTARNRQYWEYRKKILTGEVPATQSYDDYKRIREQKKLWPALKAVNKPKELSK